MPLPYNVNASRDDITDILTSRADQSPMAQMAAAIPNMPMAAPPAGQMGMIPTPAGGVPGSGVAPGMPSNLPMPQAMPRQQGMSLPLTGMGTMPELAQGGVVPQMPQAPPLGMPQGMTGMPAGPAAPGMPQMNRRPRPY